MSRWDYMMKYLGIEFVIRHVTLDEVVSGPPHHPLQVGTLTGLGIAFRIGDAAPCQHHRCVRHRPVELEVVTSVVVATIQGMTVTVVTCVGVSAPANSEHAQKPR